MKNKTRTNVIATLKDIGCKIKNTLTVKHHICVTLNNISKYIYLFTYTTPKL